MCLLEYRGCIGTEGIHLGWGDDVTMGQQRREDMDEEWHCDDEPLTEEQMCEIVRRVAHESVPFTADVWTALLESMGIDEPLESEELDQESALG